MDSVYDFLSSNTFLLFFVNGLAFFSLGLAIALEAQRASALPMAKSLWLLSVHGFVAGIGNWLEMVVIVREGALLLDNEPLLQVFRLVLFLLGAIFLLQYAIRLSITLDPKYRWLHFGFAALCLLYMGTLVSTVLASPALDQGWLAKTEVWARYLLYLPGLLLSGLAMLGQRRFFIDIGLPGAARDCVRAAVAFGLNAVVAGLIAVPMLNFAGSRPSSLIYLLQWVRAIGTVGILYTTLRFVRVFEFERRRQLARAAQERFDAQAFALKVQRQTCEEIKRWSISVADMAHTVSSAINQPLDLQEILRIVLRGALDLTGLESGGVWLLEEQAKKLMLVAHQGLSDRLVRARQRIGLEGGGPTRQCARSGELVVVDDYAHDPFASGQIVRDELRSSVSVPLKSRSEVLGVMSLGSSRKHELGQQRLALLTMLGEQLGVAIANARLHDQLKGMVALEERVRLSHELHDSLAQVLGYLNLKSLVAQRLIASEQRGQAMVELQDMEKVSSRAYDELRDSIFGLRVTLSPEQDLVSALEKYVCDFGERSQIQVILDTEHWEPVLLPADTKVQFLRIIQEALTNVRRHARASRAWLTFRVDEAAVSIRIRDDGQGFDPANARQDSGRHLGLQTMRERAESVGAGLEIDSQPGQGTEIVITLQNLPGGQQW